MSDDYRIDEGDDDRPITQTASPQADDVIIESEVSENGTAVGSATDDTYGGIKVSEVVVDEIDVQAAVIAAEPPLDANEAETRPGDHHIIPTDQPADE
jgi:hypothetical protein